MVMMVKMVMVMVVKGGCDGEDGGVGDDGRS